MLFLDIDVFGEIYVSKGNEGNEKGVPGIQTININKRYQQI